MATAKSDTKLTTERDDLSTQWADWTIVDPVGFTPFQQKSPQETDEKWLLVAPTPPLEDYVEFKKSTFVIEALNWAFGWFTQRERKGKKKNTKRKSKGKFKKGARPAVFSPAVEKRLSEMFQKVVESAIYEIIDENLSRNECMLQQMLADVIETAWTDLWEEDLRVMDKTSDLSEANKENAEITESGNIQEDNSRITQETLDTTEAKEERESGITKVIEADEEKRAKVTVVNLDIIEARSNIFERMLDHTVENACEESELANLLNHSSEDTCSMSVITTSETDKKGPDRMVQKEENNYDNQESWETNGRKDQEESVLSKHEKTLEKVGMFYNRMSDDDLMTDEEIIQKARQYVQDIMVVSLDILNEEQTGLQGFSFEDDAIADSHTMPLTTEGTTSFDPCPTAQTSIGGGDSAHYNPGNVTNKPNFRENSRQSPGTSETYEDIPEETIVKQQATRTGSSKTPHSDTEIDSEAIDIMSKDYVLQRSEREIKDTDGSSENNLHAVGSGDLQEPEAANVVITKEGADNNVQAPKNTKKENASRLRRLGRRFASLCFWKNNQTHN